MSRQTTPESLARKVFTGINAQKNAGKAVAKLLHYEGREGGWIYSHRGTCILQGYASLAAKYGCRYDADAKGYRFSVDGLARLCDHADRINRSIQRDIANKEAG